MSKRLLLRSYFWDVFVLCVTMKASFYERFELEAFRL